MNISQKLYISQKECFDAIIKSVIYDIKQSTGKSKQMRQLEGFSYQRDMSNGARATIAITEVKPYEQYVFETKSRVNTHITTYAIKATSEGTCEASYHEKIEAEGTVQKLNNMIVGFLFGIFRRKRAKNLLKAIELSVINESKAKKQNAASNAE
ncbi:DUF3284 domain-containing protein [Listeria sp. ILCC792]|uniref:DUF3284 domain-containing protein n=1 Tax=Listeria sp. ILCC792 TaxID=1918331 RepID=UPI000B59602D|nr:DUF3284 domain-containing protein [Listeria sp. ILCC792]